VSRKADQEELARVTRQIAARAARRLDFLEWVIMAGAGVAAAVGGALLALLLGLTVGLPFRITWIVASLLLFIIPGWLALRKVKKEDRERREKILNRTETSDV
jgi:uncharacterized membrane protein